MYGDRDEGEGLPSAKGGRPIVSAEERAKTIERGLKGIKLDAVGRGFILEQVKATRREAMEDVLGYIKDK